MSIDAALRYAPIMMLDAREPFRPVQVGYTLLEHTQSSPSFLREVEIVPPAVRAIEYAIWWEWDMGHLLDLEHVWVYRDLAGSGSLAHERSHVVVLALPGRHSCCASPEDLAGEVTDTERVCGTEAGRRGLLIPHLYLERLRKDPRDDALICAYLQRRSFAPSW